MALPTTLCLTCNQNNSNPVTVCISAKFLNFISRQQAPRYDRLSFRFQQNLPKPQHRATGKLNASEQGQSYTFPLCTQSSAPAPHPGGGVGAPGCLWRSQDRPHAPPPLGSCWVLVSAQMQMEIGYRGFLLKKKKRKKCGGGENHSANR